MSRITKVVLVGEVEDGKDPVMAELESEAGGNRYGGKIITSDIKPTFIIVDEMNPVKGRDEPMRHTIPVNQVGIDPNKTFREGEYIWVEEKYFPRQAIVPLAGGPIPFTVVPNFPPDFLGWIKDQFRGIPEDHIRTSMIRFTEKGIEILFTRPETPEMIRNRVEIDSKKAKHEALKQEKEEIAQYKKLHRKYGNRDKSALDDE